MYIAVFPAALCLFMLLCCTLLLTAFPLLLFASQSFSLTLFASSGFLTMLFLSAFPLKWIAHGPWSLRGVPVLAWLTWRQQSLLQRGSPVGHCPSGESRVFTIPMQASCFASHLVKLLSLHCEVKISAVLPIPLEFGSWIYLRRYPFVVCSSAVHHVYL